MVMKLRSYMYICIAIPKRCLNGDCVETESEIFRKKITLVDRNDVFNYSSYTPHALVVVSDFVYSGS